jgi:hypothetical protein
MPPQPHSNPARVIGSIATKMARALARAATPPPDVYARSNSFELGRLVCLPRQHTNGQRQSTAIR